MISYVTLDDYFGKWKDHDDVTDEVMNNAIDFLDKLNRLMDVAFMDGHDFKLNAKTQSFVSGSQYGGFRPQDCPQGAPHSSHKVGRGVDIYDPDGEFDKWCIAHPQDMRDHGLYMEDPADTPRWCHLTDRAPASGKLVFKP